MAGGKMLYSRNKKIFKSDKRVLHTFIVSDNKHKGTMLSERQVPKGVQTLKLQIEIFALETKKANKQTEKQNTCKK